MKSFQRLAIVLVLTASPFATAGLRDDAPPIKDPFEGIADRATIQPNGRTRIDGLGTRRLAVVLSTNTTAQMKWSEEAMGGPGAADRFFGTLFGGKAHIDEADRLHRESFSVKATTDAVMKPLVGAAREVVILPDLASFKDSDCDEAVLVDVAFVNQFNDGFIIGGSYKTGTFIKAFFFDRQLRMGPTVEVGKQKDAERNRFIFEVADVRRDAFAEYSRQIAQVSARPPAGVASPETASTTTRADRLKELGELRDRGLISADEYEVKRRKILEEI